MNTRKPFEPDGIRFLDGATGIEMMIVTAGHAIDWLCYRHPDGDWVTVREATADDWKAVAKALGEALV